MLTIKYCGGLGNQLFQIFTLISTAIDNLEDFKLVFASSSPSIFKNRSVYWDTVFKKLKNMLVVSLPKNIGLSFYKELNFEFNKIIVPKNVVVVLEGYFQSYLYFDHNIDYLLDILEFNKIRNEIKNKYNMNYCEYTSIHFRLGDYKKLQDHHANLDETYYIESIKEIQKHKNTKSFLIFYEEEDKIQISKMLKNIADKIKPFDYMLINTDIPDHEQLFIMSLCENNIIANSSFSWWGAYLNDNKNKIVTYPNKWFGPSSSFKNTKDLCRPDWIKIN